MSDDLEESTEPASMLLNSDEFLAWEHAKDLPKASLLRVMEVVLREQHGTRMVIDDDDEPDTSPLDFECELTPINFRVVEGEDV